MGTLYIETTGAITNSGSTDQDAADLSGTGATVSGATVTLDGTPDLSGVVTSGAAQSTIYVDDATNANQKIFWITAVDDGADTVDTSPSITGVTSSNWAIGGRHVLDRASIEAVPRAGDTLMINDSPAAGGARRYLFRTSGDLTDGPIKMIGKTGVRPLFDTTSSGQGTVSFNGQTHIWVENIEVKQQGTAQAFESTSGDLTILNVKVSDTGGASAAIQGSGHRVRIIRSEFTGCAAGAIDCNGQGWVIFGNHIHDNTGNGILIPEVTPNVVIAKNTIDTNTGRGIYFSAAIAADSNHIAFVEGNTIYGNGDSGMEITDINTHVVWLNNIFQDNGDAAGESNVEWQVADAEVLGFHAWNVMYDNTGADAPINVTVNAHVASSELTTDPQMTDPANGDFTLGALSPAKGTGFPGQLLGGSLGVLDMGAVQRAEAGGGGGVKMAGRGGGMVG